MRSEPLNVSMSAAFLLTIVTFMPTQGLPVVEETPYRNVAYVPIIDGPRLSRFYAQESA